MNAFDAARTSAGDTGLAGLFAATATPANGQAAQGPPPGVTPFAQLLGELNALPVPQGSGAPVPLPVAQAGAVLPALARLPGQQFRQLADTLTQAVAPAEQAPRLVALNCGLHLSGTGKIVPPAVPRGTILPAEPATEGPQTETGETLAALPIADQPAGAAEPQLVAFLPLPSPTIATTTTMRPADGGTVRADPAIAREPAMPPVAASTSPTYPAAPAIMLTAAGVPALAAGDGAAAMERASREPAFATASTRPPVPVLTDAHAAGIAEPAVAALQLRPEPQQPAMQDLTQIVERLTAAREAAAPAATQLSVDHAEFGPLSLSIRQGDRGELAIAVAAADRDSQAALVAAIAQGEAPGFEQAPDRRGSESAGREPATASQQGEPRGQGGQRDRLAGQQQQRQPMPQRGPAQDQDGETRNGTYA
jgi:hypothetical protein